MNHRWLSRERLKVYPRVLLTLYIAAVLLLLTTADGQFDRFGRVLGTDFVSYYGAAKLALSGQASLVYDLAAHFHAEKLAVGANLERYYGFFYPPTFLLILMPLGVLPYLLAFLVWQAVTLVFVVLMLVKMAGRGEAIMLTLAFPAVLVGFVHGQNAFLTTGLLVGALYYTDRKPIVAGLMIGLLTLKPHLGVLIPFYLIISGRWRVFSSAVVTTLCYVILSWAVFGSDVWIAFFANLNTPTVVLTEGIVAFHKMQSFFSTLRSLGLEPGIAYLLHSILALVGFGSVVWIWSQKVDIRLHSAALGVGTLIVSPFVLDYDLMILAVPIVCMASYGQSYGFRRGLLEVMCAAWFAPLFLRSLNYILPVPWTPILLSVFLYQIVRTTAEHGSRNR